MKKTDCLFFLFTIFLTACSIAPKKIEIVPQKNEILPVSQAPKKIQDASNSVLLVIFADLPKVIDLSTENKISNFLNPQIPYSSLEKYIIFSQIEVCKKTNQMNHCSVSREMKHATAFVMKDRKHLYMNYHTFFEYIKKVIQVDPEKESLKNISKKISHVQLPIFFVNNKGQFILSPHLNTTRVSNLSVMNLFPKNESKLLSDYDFVELELDSELTDVKPLEMSPVDERDTVYLLGYVQREFDGQSNISLHFSNGKYLPYDRAAEKLNFQTVALMSKQTADLANNATFFFDGHSLPGMSGGPYLNQGGKVVGIHRGTRESAENLELSIGIKSQFMMSFPFSIKGYQ